MTQRFFLGCDSSGHDYLVPVERREDFNRWSDLPEDDPEGWEEPSYATRIDGPYTLTFTDPKT